MTVRTFLIRGLIAGFIAGILTFAVAHTIGEPPVGAAIAFEEANAAPEPAEHSHDEGAAAEHSHDAEDAEVSRANQSTWGLLTATLVFGTFLGGLIGLVAAYAAGRLGRLLPAGSTAVVAALGFVSFYLVPYLKYPPNPPAVGDPNTITERTAQYFSIVLISVVAAVAAVVLSRTLTRTLGTYRGLVIPALGYLAIVVVASMLLPSINEVPRDFSPSVLWDFRVASVGTQATLWATIGLVLSGLIAHAYSRETAKQEHGLVGTAR